MDKLQPLIKQRFWILAALVLPLCIFGYYKANGAMKDATTARVEALETAYKNIPSGDGPNPTWTEEAKQLNASYKAAVNVELVRVWEDQQARMTWPPSMQRYVPAEYRGEFPEEAGFTYKDEYSRLIADLHASVEPITPDPKGKGFSGKVWFDQKLIPRHVLGTLSVPSEKIWDAQEDIWYLQLILDAVRNVNRSAENAAKAPVRKIYKIELRGGTGESTVKASGTTMSGEGTMAGMHGAGAMEMQAEMTGQRSGQGGFTAKVAFDPAEEFGTQTKAGESTSTSTSGPAEAMHMAGPGGMGGGGRGELLRYIKEDENAKFRERGFYLSVLIDQKKIPDFLVELSNAEWPIRIVRFHVGPSVEKPGTGSAGNMMEEYAAGYDTSGQGNSGFDSFDPAAAFADPALLEGATMDMQVGPSPLVTSEQMAGLFTHPDLVQMDVCGVITFYNPPAEEILAAVQATSSAAPDAGSAQEVPSTPEAIPAAESVTAEPPGVPEPDAPGSVVIPGAAPAAEAEDAAADTPVPAPTDSAPDEAGAESPSTNNGDEPGAAPGSTPPTESTPAPE
jgi:hypothetical protein